MKKIACTTLTLVLLMCSTLPAFATVNYSYDANGNLTSDGTNCYVYNEANQLKQVKNCSNNQLLEEYLYDANGIRIIKKVYQNSVLNQTIYSPTKTYESKKLADNTTQNTSYYFANDQLVAKKNPDASFNYFQDDQLGSTSLTTNQTGGVLENSSFFPYGETRGGGTIGKYQFTGQEKDATGLYYYGARFYNPHIAHFTQPDTIIGNVYDPQSLNRYSYVRDNPIKNTDPTGNSFQAVALAAGGIGAFIAPVGAYVTLAGFLIPAAALVGGAAYGVYDCAHNSGCGGNYLNNAAMGAQLTYEGSVNMTISLMGAGMLISDTGNAMQQASDMYDQIAKFNPLAKFRKNAGLPEADGSKPEAGAVAQLNIDRSGKSTYGVSSNKSGLKVPEINSGVNAVTSTHAEGQAFATATGLGFIKPGDTGSLIIDRDPCGFCSTSGGIKSLFNLSGMDELRVSYPSGNMTYRR